MIAAIADGIWTITGLSRANAHLLEGQTGLVVVDTGNSLDEGHEILRLIRTVSAKPVVAVIYTHSHYVHGARALAGPTTRIIAHPRLTANMAQPVAVTLERRHRAQYGRDLPGQPALFDHGPAGFLPPTETVAGPLAVDGLQFVVHTDYSFDTDDCLILWLPAQRLAIHNHLTGNFPNVYSIGGGRFRDPVPWMAGLEQLLAHAPEHLLGCHGPAIHGAAQCRERLTVAHDALRFVYDEAVRGINEGLTPDELVERVQLPAHLAQHPALQQTYGEVAHHVRAIFAGLVGWFSGDAVDLGAVPVRFEAEQIVAGFGGAANVLTQAQAALVAGNPAWAARLARYLVRAEPANRAARQLLAAALRGLAGKTTAWSTRNYCLTAAQALETDHNR